MNQGQAPDSCNPRCIVATTLYEVGLLNDSIQLQEQRRRYSSAHQHRRPQTAVHGPEAAVYWDLCILATQGEHSVEPHTSPRRAWWALRPLTCGTGCAHCWKFDASPPQVGFTTNMLQDSIFNFFDEAKSILGKVLFAQMKSGNLCPFQHVCTRLFKHCVTK